MNVKKWRIPLVAMSLALGLAALASEQEPAGTSVARNMSALKFGPVPGMPTCLSGAVEHGDPMKGAGLVIAKLASGCSIPWHWHTAGEYVMVVSGKGEMEMKDATSEMLTAGGFARLPPHHIHQFTCKAKCTLFIYSDAAFDIHYANAEGNEIPAEDALKAVKEKPAAKM